MAKRRFRKWVMPPWMEPFRGHFQETGGNPIEELMNDHTTTAQINLCRAVFCICVKAQVALLTRLHKDGGLTAPVAAKDSIHKDSGS